MTRAKFRLYAICLTLAAMSTLFGGCDLHTMPHSVENGECKAFDDTRPPYVVLGKTQYDQDVMDSVVETGVAACKWPRPEPRPASIDAQPAPRLQPAAQKQQGMMARAKAGIKAKAHSAKQAATKAARSVWPPSNVQPIAPTAPVADVKPAAPEPEQPAPKPERSEVDKLLYPGDDD
ncbi:hypothetical protein [Bradyrhizobium elkanii]|uniref:hypothetical protein n=1 Tax=Bradyrhizobium elkanii TaxID=29448 RepID=UPI0008419F36|nr:hypothetical protein [Bradyrhizobium elkanii]ODM71665.1 hypothetical protein A6X20_06905 [Bradyrhizobium elkanii]ODM79037.1 hypothetical protein A6452_28490 [Bradyrhizobium elkanii]